MIEPVLKKNNFTQRVRQIVREIPKGQTMSYKEVAEVAGSKNAFRAVGTIMKNNFDESIPCHRVIASDGSIGGYNRGGTKRKKELLEKEGVILL